MDKDVYTSDGAERWNIESRKLSQVHNSCLSMNYTHEVYPPEGTEAWTINQQSFPSGTYKLNPRQKNKTTSIYYL